MAWFETGGGGGSELSETALWTNPSPTSSLGGSAGLTISDISSYKYLKIYWRLTINQDIQNNILVSVEEFKKMTNAANTNFVGMYSKGTNSFIRGVYYVNDTTFGVSNCYQAGATTQNNGYCIPTKISGLK